MSPSSRSQFVSPGTDRRGLLYCTGVWRAFGLRNANSLIVDRIVTDEYDRTIVARVVGVAGEQCLIVLVLARTPRDSAHGALSTEPWLR